MKVNNIIKSTVLEYLKEEASFNKLIKLYHGTKNNYNLFDLKFFNSGSGDSGWLGYGIYLTNDYEYAKSYAEPDGYVLECEVNINNPYILTDSLYSRRPEKLRNELNVNNSREITKLLSNDGYDSVVLKYFDDQFSSTTDFIEINVFNPNNIRIINRYHIESENDF